MKKTKKNQKMWGGRFKTGTHPLVERFTSSLKFDHRLYRYDIEGSIAWTRALGFAKVLRHDEAAKIEQGLRAVRKEIESGKVKWEAGDEDIHAAVERLLAERIGPVAGKLHTGRSRNDQVSTDLRLYLRDINQATLDSVRRLQKVLLDQAQKHTDVVMPGYTHLQRAQPVLLAHHLLAYAEMLDRDAERLKEGLRRANVLPLGSGALAGTSFPISREKLSQELGFREVSQNSLDAVSDRDFVVEFLSMSSMVMMHLSRLSEELILWATQEFGFVELPESICTGSSLMPQKKNPDPLELIRAKAGRVYGSLVGFLTVMKGLPLTYNRDMQEDKEALFDSADTLKDSLQIMELIIKKLVFRKEIVTQAGKDPFLLSTDLADYLVEKGLPFREAHYVVGQVVRYCISRKRDLTTLTIKELNRFSRLFDRDVMGYLSLSGSLDRKQQTGGTGKRQIAYQIRRLRERIVRDPGS